MYMGQKKITRTACVCERCGYEWVARKDRKPITCANCRSPYWDIKKRNKDGN